MRRLLALVPCVLALACASASHGFDVDEPLQVAFYQGGVQQLTLVNEAHTNKVVQYSTKAQDASTKVATNEVMEALLERFRELGFFDRAEEGGSGSLTDGRALEIEAPDGRTMFAVNATNTPQDWQAFASCRKAFVEIWNGIFAPQSVDNPRGEAIFGTNRQRSR